MRDSGWENERLRTQRDILKKRSAFLSNPGRTVCPHDVLRVGAVRGRGQDADNGDGHREFHEGETSLAAPAACPGSLYFVAHVHNDLSSSGSKPAESQGRGSPDG